MTMFSSMPSVFQLVQPSFQSTLGHIRSGTLDEFKEAFDKALSGGEGFSAAANNCIGSAMDHFDAASAGNQNFVCPILLHHNELMSKA